MRKKYELTTIKRGFIVNGETKAFYQIRALRNIPSIGVKAGDMGGYLHDESCLSQSGDCWVFENSCVDKGGKVEDDAQVRGESAVGSLAVVLENAIVETSEILSKSIVKGKALIINSDVSGGSIIAGSVVVTKSRLLSIYVESGKIMNTTLQSMNHNLIDFKDYTHLEDCDLDIYDMQGICTKSIRLKSVTATELVKLRVLEHIVISNAVFEGETSFLFGMLNSQREDVTHMVSPQGKIYGKDVELITSKATVKGEVQLVGKVELYQSRLQDCASLLNYTERWLTLNHSVVSECASIQKDSPMTGSIFKNETLEGDIRVTC